MRPYRASGSHGRPASATPAAPRATSRISATLIGTQPSPLLNVRPRNVTVLSPKSNDVPQPAAWIRNQAAGSPTRRATHPMYAGTPASATRAATTGLHVPPAPHGRAARTARAAATARPTAAAAPVGRDSAAARPSRPAAHQTWRWAATNMPATRPRKSDSEYAMESTTDTGAEQQIATSAQPARLP